MRFVELKSAEQLDMQSLHRVRDRLVSERTALINQLPADLLERSFTAPQGRRKLAYALAILLDETDEQSSGATLSSRTHALVKGMRGNGPNSTGESGLTTTNSQLRPRQMRRPGAWPLLPASGC